MKTTLQRITKLVSVLTVLLASVSAQASGADDFFKDDVNIMTSGTSVAGGVAILAGGELASTIGGAISVVFGTTMGVLLIATNDDQNTLSSEDPSKATSAYFKVAAFIRTAREDAADYLMNGGTNASPTLKAIFVAVSSTKNLSETEIAALLLEPAQLVRSR